MKFKARVIGMVKKVPGFYNISGYRPGVYLGMPILVSED